MGHAQHNSGNRSAAAGERPGFDKDQPSESPGKRKTDSGVRRRDPAPATFDEGEAGPAPIESTTDDNARPAPPKKPASTSQGPDTDTDVHVNATMPPGEGRDPKRNTI